jgi:hypothetical protein
MNGHNYLADTNTFIFLLNEHPSVKPLLSASWYYSVITEIELKGKHKISPSELKVVTRLLEHCNKIPLTEDIEDITIKLRQQYKIKTPDAIIAATSISRNIPLLTFDKGFEVVKSLDIVLLEL